MIIQNSLVSIEDVFSRKNSLKRHMWRKHNTSTNQNQIPDKIETTQNPEEEVIVGSNRIDEMRQIIRNKFEMLHTPQELNAVENISNPIKEVNMNEMRMDVLDIKNKISELYKLISVKREASNPQENSERLYYEEKQADIDGEDYFDSTMNVENIINTYFGTTQTS